jgi:hypothetical protein
LPMPSSSRNRSYSPIPLNNRSISPLPMPSSTKST